MSGDWNLDPAGQKAWKAYITELRGDHKLVSLVVEMGLKASAVSQLSRFAAGHPTVLGRWFDGKPGKYIEPFAAAVKTSAPKILHQFRALQAGTEATEGAADWHAAFPGVRREDAIIAPPWRGKALDDLKAWQKKSGMPVKVIGLPGSGRRTLVAWLSAHEIDAAVGGRPVRGALEDGSIQTEPWTPTQVGALAQRLAQADSVDEVAQQHLKALHVRLESEPALARLAEDPGSAIKFLAQVAHRGVPDARSLRDELLRTEWTRFRNARSTGWNTLVQEETIDALLFEGFLSGAADRLSWQEAARQSLPSAVNLAEVQADLDQIATARGAARVAATDRMRQRLTGWSAGPAVDAMLNAGWLLEDDYGVHPARWPLALSRMARRIVQGQERRWFARCGHCYEAMALVRECAVWGLRWHQLKAVLQGAPDALRLDVANAAVAFAAHADNHAQAADDPWFVEQWASALWASTAGCTLMGENLGALRWGVDNLMGTLFEGRWATGRDFMRLSVEMAGALPRLHGDDPLRALGEHVPAAAKALVRAWYGEAFPPERREERETKSHFGLDFPHRTHHDRHLQVLAHLAPAQCIPTQTALLLRWHVAKRPKTFFLEAWNRAAEAGDTVAIRLLGLSRREPYAQRWIGCSEPDEEQLKDALELLNIWGSDPVLTSDSAIEVLGRFPKELVSEHLLAIAPQWSADRLPELVGLAEATQNRVLLRHFADWDARCAEFYDSTWRRSREKYSLWLTIDDAAEQHTEDALLLAFRARSALHGLGEPDLLREWALTGLPNTKPEGLAAWAQVPAGAQQFHARQTWDDFSARLPDDAQCIELLAELSEHPSWMFTGSPFMNLLPEAIERQELGLLAGLIDHASDDWSPTWRNEQLALHPLKSRPAGADGPRLVLAVALLLWRSVNTHSQLQFVRFLAAQAEPPAAPQWTGGWLASTRRKAIDALIDLRDATILQPLFEYEGDLQQLREWNDLVAGRVAAKRDDDDIKRWILSEGPPQRVRDWLVPPPRPEWRHKDSYFAETRAPGDRFMAAFYSGTDARAEPLMRGLLSEARAAGALSAELFWSLRLKEPLADLAGRWLEAGLFQGAPRLSGILDRDAGMGHFEGGWLIILAELANTRQVEALLGLIDIAPTEKPDTFAKIAAMRRQAMDPDAPRPLLLDLEYDSDLPWRSSPAHMLGAALQRCASSDRLLALGRPMLERLGLSSFWLTHADPAALLALLADREGALPTEQSELSVLDELCRQEDEATFDWLEAELRARTDWRQTPGPITIVEWETHLRMLLRWRPARALRALDVIETTGTPAPIELVYELAPWADHPGIANRLRRWTLALAQ